MIISILIVLIILTGCSTKPAKYNTFAQCISSNGAVMYGTDWCSHCQSQKKMFGKSFEYINFVDCDKQRDQCLIAGVQGYPTWVIDGELYPGEQKLERLASLTGCEFAEDQI